MALRLITPPAALAVSLTEAKGHLRIEDTASDTLLTDIYLPAAIGRLDGEAGVLRRALVTQTYELVLDAFPDDDGGLRIPLPPLVSVDSVKYLDGALDEITMVDGTDYTVDTASEPGWIMPGDAGWPEVGETINAVVVRFTAGYGAAAAVPPLLKAAILLMVADLFENRAAVGAKLEENPTVQRLIDLYRIPYFA